MAAEAALILNLVLVALFVATFRTIARAKSKKDPEAVGMMPLYIMLTLAALTAFTIAVRHNNLNFTLIVVALYTLYSIAMILRLGPYWPYKKRNSGRRD